MPDDEAGRVTIPVVVRLGDVSYVVELLGWVVLVDVLGLAVDGALEVVSRVFYAPEPVTVLKMGLISFCIATYMLFLSKVMPTSLRCP